MRVLPCPTPAGVVSVQIPDGLPIVLRSALQASLGDIAKPDEKFDETDIVVTGRSRRFLFVWNISTRWIIAKVYGPMGPMFWPLGLLM
jgi:hypothetical protein